MSELVHGEDVDGLNYTSKIFLFQLKENIQLTVAKGYETHMIIHSATSITDVSLAREFPKQLSNVAYKHGVIDKGKIKNGKVNEIV